MILALKQPPMFYTLFYFPPKKISNLLNALHLVYFYHIAGYLSRFFSSHLPSENKKSKKIN